MCPHQHEDSVHLQNKAVDMFNILICWWQVEKKLDNNCNNFYGNYNPLHDLNYGGPEV